MARPLNPDSGRYDLRAEPDAIRAWQEAAEQDGRSLASWIVATLNRSAAAQLRKNGASEKSTRRRRLA